MRTVLFSLFLTGCHVGHLFDPNQSNLTILDKSSGIKCELAGAEYDKIELVYTFDPYLAQAPDAGYLLVFYESDDHTGELTLIQCECEGAHVYTSEEGLTGIFLNLDYAFANHAVNNYFNDDGEQALIADEEIWLMVWALEDGELKTFELLISEAGNEEQTGSCELVLKPNTTP